MNKLMSALIVLVLAIPITVSAVPRQPLNVEVDPSTFSMEITWTANTDNGEGDYDVTTGYYVDYWEIDDESKKWRVNIDGAATDDHTIKGLEKNTEYRIEVSAYSGEGDTVSSTYSVIESTTAEVDVEIKITDIDTIEVSVDFDGSGISVYYAAITEFQNTSNVYMFQDGIPADESCTFKGLELGNYTLIIRESASDPVILEEEDFLLDSMTTFFSANNDKIEDGCFISSQPESRFSLFGLLFIATIPVAFLLRKRSHLPVVLLGIFLLIGAVDATAEEDDFYKNVFGAKGGWFEPSERDQKDVYDEIVPFSLFYERFLTKHISADIDLGFSKSDGNADSASSGVTTLETEMKMYPAAVSLNFNYDITDIYSVYLGIGGDWWMVEEESPLGEFEYEVGGWHAKTGVKIFSDELELMRQIGCLFEVSYTQIDRFGQNDIDLGGWKFNFGLIYCR